MDRIKLLHVRGVLQAWRNDWQGAEQYLHDALTMADHESWVEPFALRPLLNAYAEVLRKNHRRREARSVGARAAAIQLGPSVNATVDITELLPKAKPVKE